MGRAGGRWLGWLAAALAGLGGAAGQLGTGAGVPLLTDGAEAHMQCNVTGPCLPCSLEKEKGPEAVHCEINSHYQAASCIDVGKKGGDAAPFNTYRSCEIQLEGLPTAVEAGSTLELATFLLVMAALLGACFPVTVLRKRALRQ